MYHKFHENLHCSFWRKKITSQFSQGWDTVFSKLIEEKQNIKEFVALMFEPLLHLSLSSEYGKHQNLFTMKCFFHTNCDLSGFPLWTEKLAEIQTKLFLKNQAALELNLLWPIAFFQVYRYLNFMISFAWICFLSPILYTTFKPAI